jgi:release factor glutamine methyltransferase
MSLRSSLTASIDRLTAAHVGSPRMNAELLLMFVLGCDRAYLFSHPERELTADEQARYEEAIAQRVTGIPAQYITGHQEFWGIDFIVSPAVLIPRPETEHVIETALSLSHERKNLRIIDVGTGSGCIAIAFAKELPTAEIHAVDVSPGALEVARANAARHPFAARIEFRQNDLLAGLEPHSFDLVISNPPYVGESEEDTVQLEVRKFEPRNAVFAGHTGLEVIERLVPQASRTLKSGGWLAMEISGTIATGARELLTGWKDIRTINDLQGIARVIAARKQ